jgi:VWFA-related protein
VQFSTGTKAFRTIPVAALLLVASAALLAQSTLSVVPAPTPPQPASTPRLRTDVRLVILDVTVLDKQGAPVHGLKLEDFQLRENDTPQKITSLEEHRSAAPAATGPPSVVTVSANGVATFSNAPTPSAIWNVLLVDQLNTSMEDQARALKQLQLFVKQLPPDQMLALVTMSGEIKVVVPFEERAGAISRLLEKDGLKPINASPPADLGIGASNRPEALENKARIDVEQQAHRAQATLDCFSAIAKWLTNYPGRKNVYWLTSGFPLAGQPFGVLGYTQATPTGPANHGSQTIPQQQVVDKQLENARVAIYPIDARGVARPDIAGETSADTEGTFLSVGKETDKTINVKKDDQLKASQQGEMQEIALATGGIARSSNNIAQTLRDDFNQGQSYYTLSYTPANSQWDGAYRRIALTLNEKYQLTYRRGYFARDAQPTPPTGEQFRAALAHGAPSATSVRFSLKLSKSTDSANAEYAIDRKTLDYTTESPEKLAAKIDCALLEYDSSGKLLDATLVRVTSRMNTDQRAELSNTPLQAKQTIALKPGAKWLAIGVRDNATGEFGTYEVDLAGIPVTAAAQAQQTVSVPSAPKSPSAVQAQATEPVPPAPKGLIQRTPAVVEEQRKAEHHITLDVAVSDPSGKPVGDLVQQNFQLFDNAQPQPITSFRKVEGRTAEPPVEIILLLDTVNTPFNDVAIQRQEMEKFLRQNNGQLSLPVSIVFLSDAAVKLNQPSRDGNALAADMAKLQTPMRINGAAQGFDGLLQRFQASIRTLTQLSTYEATRPGRKLMIWIGPGWPILSGSAFRFREKDQKAFFNSIVDVSTRLREARITLYSVGPVDLNRGQARAFLYKNYLGGVTNVKDADSGNLAVQVIAVQSGGLALDPNGNMAALVSQCVADANVYYEISFDVAPSENADEYHALEIKLDKPGLKARTRSAYYSQP